MPQGGNQCALSTDSYRPCYLEAERGQPPVLQNCEWNGSERAEDFVTFRLVHIGEPPDKSKPGENQ